MPHRTPPERRRLGTTPSPPGRPRLLHDLVLRQARITPDAIAVQDPQEALTYQQLLARADALAAALRTAGTGPDVLVGVCMERSVRLVVSLLGILLADGAYLALDPEHPVARLAHMARVTATPLVLADERNRPTALQALGEQAHTASVPLQGLELLHSPTHPPTPARRPPEPTDLAYVLFTSGSTGTPKGVAVPHRGIVANLGAMQSRYGLGRDDSVLQKAPYSFDSSLWEIFWPLTAGARIVLAEPGGQRDPAYLAELIRTESVTTVQTVPSLLALLVEGDLLIGAESLRRVLCIGEALQSTTANRFREVSTAELHNLYGPTEASVGVTHWPCRAVEPPGTVPIGHPMAGVSAHVLDGSGSPVSTGGTGELHLGGAFLARGYLGNPGLTAAQFVPDHVSGTPGARLYRTGDLVRRHPAGHLEFLGRTDHQVKVDGLRVELGEIETQLLTHPTVTRAVVVVRHDMGSTPRLTAYVTGNGELKPQSLTTHLAKALPPYMLPSFIVPLTTLPLTTNGKVDRTALPRPARGRRRRPGPPGAGGGDAVPHERA
ncbi:amino acid adenylation domain-containing protein [Streptomyces sp. NPDC050161]|uniref:amino acid adenylation domain-containing protein n=1 Tax=Streptomyces sp. NPDC050161 TaxID=3365604 RepID=UPI00378B0D95